ncbi:MAG: hypothetical protein J6Y51_01585 [Bacteroidaceae bacterium]|nr:hypothetical protein [Bacteroidaceae bacterium]
MEHAQPHTLFAIIAMALLMPACHSTRHITTTQSTATSISQKEIDSTTSHLMSTHRKTTTITFLPMQTPTLPPIPSPDAQAPSQDLITQLITQGGGTIIIEEKETQTQDQESATTQISTQDTTTTQNTQYHEKQSPQPRASPNLKLILYIILAATALLLILKWSIRQ